MKSVIIACTLILALALPCVASADDGSMLYPAQ